MADIILFPDQDKKGRVGLVHGVALWIEGDRGLEWGHSLFSEVSIDDLQSRDSPHRPPDTRDVFRVHVRKSRQIGLRGEGVARNRDAARIVAVEAWSPRAVAVHLQGGV